MASLTDDALHIYQKAFMAPHSINKDSPTEEKLLNNQKRWVIIHCLFLLFVSGISIPLLHQKQNMLNNFYNQDQCCYCLWVSNNNTVSNGYEIEWSSCHQHYNLEKNILKTCNINDHQYCLSNTTIYSTHHTLSDTSSLFWFTFPKFYPYYGIINILLVLSYIILLFITTYYYKLLISKPLFIQNLVITISCFYSYIKLYQYSKYKYHSECINPPLFKPHKIDKCYKSALPSWMDILFESLIYITTLYCLYCIYVVWPCCCFFVVRFLSKYKSCTEFGKKLKIFLLYGTIVCGLIGIFMAYGILIYILVIHKATFGIIGFVEHDMEQVFIMLIATTLMFSVFDILLIENGRKMFNDILTCKNTGNEQITDEPQLYVNQIDESSDD